MQSENLNSKEKKLSGLDIILIIVSFFLPLAGIVCLLIIEKDKRAHKAIKISTITGLSLQVLLILMFVLFVVMWLKELTPYIQEGIESSAHFFEVF